MAKKTVYSKTYNDSLKLTNRNFQAILDFYLFQCPTPGKSKRARVFSKLGWSGQKQFSQLKKKLLASATSSLNNNYHPCKRDDLPAGFEKVEKVHPVDEYCVFLKTDEKSVMQSLFSAIRNALAHGSFSVQQFKSDGKTYRIYFFSNFKDYLKAEIVLQEETLLNWIEIVKSGYDPNWK